MSQFYGNRAPASAVLFYVQHEVSLHGIIRSMHSKYDCVTVNVEKVLHRIYLVSLKVSVKFCLDGISVNLRNRKRFNLDIFKLPD